MRLIFASIVMLGGASLVACDGGSDAVRTTAAPTGIAGSPPAAPDDTPTPDPTPSPTPIAVSELPIIDLHFHPDAAWGEALLPLLDQLNVRTVGSGAQASDSDALALAVRFEPRVVSFAGGYPLRQFVLQLGAAAWNLESAEVEAYLDALEADLAGGRFRGIGEIHVDSTASYFSGTPPIRFPADAPLMRRLWSVSAAHGLPLQVHMDGSEESVAAMERLLASDRDGTWLWAHTGHYAEPALVRRLLENHLNMYCELSYRSSISPSRTGIPLDSGGVLREEWRALLEEFPDRFVVGTDLSAPSAAEYIRHMGFWRAVLGQLTPGTAAMLAYRNAERLLNGGR